jgi:DNA primase
VSREDEQRDIRRKTLHDVMDLAAKFFADALAGRSGARARGYLADRGLDSSVQLKFRLGYASNERFALKEHLGSHGIPVPDMIEAGLLVSGDDIPVPFDRFRDRVMFPITDVRGRVVAFGGRALEKDAPAKYLNSPETPLFHKGHTLYNIAAARQATHEKAELVIVEGYVDVIAMVRAGWPAAVAPLGTALTEDQLTLLWKMSDEPLMCFDGDKAGQRAAYRAADMALPRLKPGKSLRFAFLPEGQDPDDLFKSGGREAIAEVLAAARPLAQVLWARETESGSFDTPERRAALEARMNELSASIADESVRRYYRQDFNDKVRALFAPPPRTGGAQGMPPRYANRNEPRRWPSGPRVVSGGRGDRRFGGQNPFAPDPYTLVSPQMATSPLHLGYRTAISRREALILQVVLNHPWLLHDHLEELTHLEFRHAEAERLKGAIIDICAQDGQEHGQAGSPEPKALQDELIRRGFAEMVEKVTRATTTGDVWGAGPEAAPADVLVTWQQLVGLHRQGNSLLKELKEAEQALAAESTEPNFLRLRDVEARISKMEGTEALIEGFGASSGRPARSF